MEAVSRPTGTRRRGAALEEVILEAAWAELTEVGFDQMTITSVAARAQTGKQVLYRRWPNRAHLAVAAVNHHAGAPLTAPPDTGSLRGDMLALLDAAVRRMSSVDPALIRSILAALLAEDGTFTGTMRSQVAVLLERAVARGELTHARVPDRVLSVPAILARHEFTLLAGSEGVLEALHEPLVEIVDQVFLPLMSAYSQKPLT